MSTQNASVGTTFKDTQKSNEYLQAILTASKDHAIVSTDIHGYILTSSIGVRSVFGILPDEASGMDILTLFTDEAFRKELAEHITSCSIKIIERKKIPQIRKKITCYLDVTFQAVADEDQNPIGFLCIVRDVTQNVLLQERLKSLSVTDEVTNFYNQRHLFPTLEAELGRSRSSNRNFVLCFFDLDGLKKYNDTYGHLRGTQAIRDTAGLIRTLTRPDLDICYRYGGDEFIIIMLETNKRSARSAVERIRLRLCEHFQGKITASFGIAESVASLDAEELVKRANRAMYRAKSQGRNCVILWE